MKNYLLNILNLGFRDDVSVTDLKYVFKRKFHTVPVTSAPQNGQQNFLLIKMFSL